MNISELNEEIRVCNKCRLSNTRINSLRGEGNLDCRIMLIAQAPGENEDRDGKMFIGPSGRVLDELLNLANVDRDEIYMTNLIKCMLPKCRKPKQDEIQMCSEYLDKEIEIINPEIIVPLGYYATRYIFRKYNIPIPDRKIFYNVYGKIIWKEKKIYPIQHPASLLYNQTFRKDMEENYKKLKIFRKECKWYQICPMKRFYEEGIIERRWVELYCKGDWEICVRYQMEESGRYHEDNMLPDGSYLHYR